MDGRGQSGQVSGRYALHLPNLEHGQIKRGLLHAPWNWPINTQ